MGTLSSLLIPKVAKSLLTEGSSGKHEAEKEKLQLTWLADHLRSEPARECTADDNSVRLLVIAQILERWDTFGPHVTPDNLYLTAVYAVDTVKIALKITFDLANLLPLSELRQRVLIELKQIENHFLRCDKSDVANIGKEFGSELAIAAVRRRFREGEVKFAEKLRRLAAELEVALNERIAAAEFQNQSNAKKGTRRSTTTINRDLEWLEEFMRDGWTSKAAFAHSKSVRRETMSQALKRAAEHKPTKRKSSSKT